MIVAKASFEGRSFSADIHELEESTFSHISRLSLTRDQLLKKIDGMQISADAKLLLSRVSNIVVQIGDKLIAVGRRLLEVALFIAHEFPMAGIGIVFGLLLGTLAGAIPLLGVILGPLLTPLAVAFGLVTGVIEDLKDRALQRRIDEAVALYEPLKGEVHVA